MQHIEPTINKRTAHGHYYQAMNDHKAKLLSKAMSTGNVIQLVVELNLGVLSPTSLCFLGAS